MVDVDGVARDYFNSYFNVLLYDTNRQPICCFHFHSKTNRVRLFDEGKNEKRFQIETLDDVYDHAGSGRQLSSTKTATDEAALRAHCIVSRLG